MDYRQKLENEYNEMIARIKEMTTENEKIISSSAKILKTINNPSDDTKRHEARVVC